MLCGGSGARLSSVYCCLVVEGAGPCTRGGPPAARCLQCSSGLVEAGQLVRRPPGRTTAQELQRQGRLAGPLVVNLTLNYAISTVSLASVGHLGTTELAAAALVTTPLRELHVQCPTWSAAPH